MPKTGKSSASKSDRTKTGMPSAPNKKPMTKPITLPKTSSGGNSKNETAKSR